MELSIAECCRLAEALSALGQGRWRDFENTLWLSFGDEWTRLRDMLVKHKHIVLRGQWKDEPVLTEHGRVLLERLTARPQSATG